MNPRIFCIVEGYGDVRALPVLVRRLAQEMQRFDVDVPPPIRCPKSKIVRKGDEIQTEELARVLRLATAKLGGPSRGAVLILLDADDACPAILGPRLLDAATSIRSDVCISVVLAKREYEAWFVAAIESLKHSGKFSPEAATHPDPESLSDPKGYLSRRMRPELTYSEPVDQPALTQGFDLDQASSCASFQKCRREIEKLLDHVSGDQPQDT